MLLTLTLALAAAADTAAPRTVRENPNAPASVIVHRQPALPVVALRLSVLADDPAGYAGAGHLVQHLHLPALEEQAARVGARVQALRTSDAVVYSVVGPADELAYLAGLLRGALRAPTPSEAQLLQAAGVLAEERAAERETAPSYARAVLRARLFPADLPPAGTALSAERLTADGLRAAWGAIYAPERVSVVAVGDVEPAAVERVFADLPDASGAAPDELPADTVPSLAADTPQATRGWIARAHAAPDADPAALSVLARLVRNNLRRRMTRSAVEVEHWWTHHGQALAIVVATQDSLMPAARRTTAAALQAVGSDISERSVTETARAVRREMLFYARTPERMAEVLGAFADRGGDEPEAAQQFFARLEEVTEDDVRAALELVAAQEAATVDVPPQRIRREPRR